MKRKIFKLITSILTSSLLLIGCNNTSSVSSKSDNKLSIVTSFYPIYISTLNIVKDVPNVELINMTKAQTGCLHDYQLTPQDLKILEKADIFVANGAGMESFLDKIISQYSSLNIIEASDGIELLEDSYHEDDDHDHDGDGIADHDASEHAEAETEHHHEENPHVWVSISNNIQQVKNIAKELSTLDPENSAKYQSNANEYIQKLEALKVEMHESLNTISNKNIVTFHEAFPYFAKEFDLNIVGVILVEPDSEPSAKEIEETIKIIKENNIKALFTEPQYSSKVVETIANETGAQIFTLDPVVTGEANEGSYDDYINKMKENLKTLKEALK
jgi:zinc transport system substrate-binding protein